MTWARELSSPACIHEQQMPTSQQIFGTPSPRIHSEDNISKRYSTSRRTYLAHRNACTRRRRNTREKGELRGIERLNLGISFSPLGVVLDLMDKVVIGMHVLIRRRHWMRVSQMGFPPMSPSEGRRSPFKERRKSFASSTPLMVKTLVTSTKHLKRQISRFSDG